MDKEKYLTKVYNYLTQNNYCLIKENNYAYSAKAVKLGNPEYFTERGYLKEYTHSKITSVDSFLQFAQWKKEPVEMLNDENLLIDFFINTFKESNKEERLLLLKNIETHI